jgi:hypothetical protein
MPIVNITAAVTGKGHPALWEEGGSAGQSGFAQIISGQDGNKLAPIFVKNSGHRSCAEHALIPVANNYYVVRVMRVRGSITVEVMKVLRIYKEVTGTKLAMNLFARTSAPETDDLSEWAESFSHQVPKAIKAAIAKSFEHHCREPRYTKDFISAADYETTEVINGVSDQHP